jgi:hypothetical protein
MTRPEEREQSHRTVCPARIKAFEGFATDVDDRPL